MNGGGIHPRTHFESESSVGLAVTGLGLEERPLAPVAEISP